MSRLPALLIVLATALPCVVLFGIFDHIDRLKKEPRRLIFKLFATGFITIIPALLLESLLLPFCRFLSPGLVVPAQAFLGIALPEEFVKIVAVLLVVRRRKDFDEIIDGAVYAVTVSMGFALLENILYVFGSDDALKVALLRGFTAIPLHALTGGIMGLGLGYLRMESRGSVSQSLFMAVIIHGVYDFFLMDPRVPGWLIVPLLVVGWAGLIMAARRAVKIDRDKGRSPLFTQV